MTVQDVQPSATFIGNGSDTSFAFVFRVDDASWLTLDYLTNFDQFILNPDQEATPGGSIEYFVAPPLLQELTVTRVTPQVQNLDYTRYDPFDAESSEDALDKLTMQIQDNQYGVEVHISDAGIHFPDAPADGNVYGRQNNAWAVAGGGGSQTPWTSNIDAAEFALNNLGSWTLSSPASSNTLTVGYDPTGEFLYFTDTRAVTNWWGTGAYWYSTGEFGIYDQAVGATQSDPPVLGDNYQCWYGFYDRNDYLLGTMGFQEFSTEMSLGNDVPGGVLSLYTITSPGDVYKDGYVHNPQTGTVRLGTLPFDVDNTVGAGQDNYVLTYDHAAGTIALEPAAGGGLNNVVEDLTPELGGNLNPNGFNLTGSIASTSWTLPNNGNFTFTGDGTGRVAFDLGTDGYWESNDGTTNVIQNHNNNDFRFSVTGTRFGTIPAIFTGFLDLRSDQPIKILEQAAADADIPNYGQLWVRNDTPNVLVFTDDTGVDTVLGGGGGLADVVDDVTPQLGGPLDANGQSISMGDNNNILFGASNDVQLIYTTGADQFEINTSATADFILQHGTDFAIYSIANAGVDLYFNNALKLQTVTGGVDITGALTATGAVTGSNLAIANWNTAFGWGDHAGLYAAASHVHNTKRTVGITIDGGGSAITTGTKGYVEVPFAGTIVEWKLIADQSGSCVVDIWKDAAVVPDNADSITAAAKPTLTAAQIARSTTLTGWITAVAVDDVFGFEVESASTITRLTLVLVIDVNTAAP